MNILTPAAAYWNQSPALEQERERLDTLVGLVGRTNDLSYYQWAQLLSYALEFEPDVILELGRGVGNSTVVFAEAARLLAPKKKVEVHSACLSDDYQKMTLPRLRESGLIDDDWEKTVTLYLNDIRALDYEAMFKDGKRVLVFWDAHGFEVANCMLGGILPLIKDKKHAILMHDLSDNRYCQPLESYGDNPLWANDTASESRVLIGNINSMQAQVVSIVDFVSRNKLSLESADHTFRTELDEEQCETMRQRLGSKFFDLQGHWFFFSLNEHDGPYFFPTFTPQAG